MSAPGFVLPVTRGTSGILRRLLRRHPARYPCLFDSAALGANGRWSILAAEPRYSLALATAGGPRRSDGLPVSAAGFLEALEHDFRCERLAGFERPAGLPFAGGWCVLLGYEAAAEIEPRLQLPASPDPWRAFALRIPAAVLHDARDGSLTVVAEPGE